MFMPRARSDRPLLILEKSKSLTFVCQFVDSTIAPFSDWFKIEQLGLQSFDNEPTGLFATAIA